MDNRIRFFQLGKFVGLLLAVCVFGGSQMAFAQDTFEDFKQEYQQGYKQYLDNFEDGVAKSKDDYEKYREAYLEEYKKFKEKMQQKWGDFKERSKKRWVEYKDGGSLRVSTDFEKGKGKVEVLAESKEEAEQIKEEMPQKTAEALKSKGTREGFETEKIPNKEITEDPVLEDQLDKPKDKSVDEYAKELVDTQTNTKKVKGKDGKTRYVVYVDFNLANNHIQKRARKVENYVYRFAKEHDLDPALVFAVIHVESYFNPTAASHANAYGLMQLVPTTGGRDAYRRIYGEDGIPTKEYLFKPANNVEMGCTFIDILTSRYFKRAKDETTRQYLMISAYNTGAGNVSVAYTGDTNLSQAFRKINSMTPQENYNYLRENLEYEEARNYLKKVTTRRDKYAEWKRKKAQN